ncbi:macrophage activating glycoprotein [Coprinopsis cinerea AmutBmut pab1-1]|nr:macrophage activating glycoprotein [Coprinopsis cinerea AmutBmut pab1-1]
MFPVALSSRLIALVMGAAMAAAQVTEAPAAPPAMETFPATPHASKTFAFEDLPYKIDTDTHLIRGPQHGFNICNSTTENQDSLCQTAHFNSLDDFCLWGPPEYGQEVGDIEGIMVAYCTKPGHGTRLIPEGALTGVQWIRTPSYVQAVGFLDQTKINVLAGDWGGEMDPHGADLRGNPMGGIVYSNAWTGSPEQVIEWHLFLGGDRFCFKACDPRDQDDDKYCEHIFDRIGCDYNVPNNAQDGVFEECEGDNQDFPGTYTDENGQVQTYTQPEGPITSIPYTARTPASSNCVTHSSAELYTGLPQPTTTDATSTPTGSVSGSGRITTSRSTGTNGGSASPSPTGDSDDSEGGAAPFGVSTAAVFGVLLSAVFLA